MITSADVYKGGQLAATLQRTPAGVVFEYRSDYAGLALASTLPFGDVRSTPAGEFSASLGLPVAVSDKVVADLLARTASLGDQLLDSALPFDRRTLDNVARQVAARRTSLEP